MMGLAVVTGARFSDAAAPTDQTYMPVVPTKSFEETLKQDSADKDKVMSDQQSLLEKRYDLRDDPSDVKMSGERKAVQQGVRVRLSNGMTWNKLGDMTPEQIKKLDAFPMGFRPLPHAKHVTGGMVFPKQEIDAIQKAESRDLKRFDVDFDIPDQFTPEFPPPMFLTSRPDLGDVSNGEVLTIKNYYRLLYGK
ncbi:MAG TPA: cytochrome B6, partial [Lacipirellulaceae bacterium]|nr:cytochrome B6 [Lacipirellulaceae bacterium]